MLVRFKDVSVSPFLLRHRDGSNLLLCPKKSGFLSGSPNGWLAPKTLKSVLIFPADRKTAPQRFLSCFLASSRSRTFYAFRGINETPANRGVKNLLRFRLKADSGLAQDKRGPRPWLSTPPANYEINFSRLDRARAATATDSVHTRSARETVHRRSRHFPQASRPAEEAPCGRHSGCLHRPDWPQPYTTSSTADQSNLRIAFHESSDRNRPPDHPLALIA